MGASSKVRYAATLRRLQAEFGAKVLFEMPDPPPPMTNVDRARARTGFESGYGRVTAWFPTVCHRSQAAFVWDWNIGPESTKLSDLQRWREREAKLLRASMLRAGFDPDLCTFISLGGRDAPPDGRMPATDTKYLRLALNAADTDYIVLVGAHAMHTWHPHVTLEQVAGQVGAWDHWWVMPTYHPNAVFRDLVTPDAWRQQLAKFRQRIDENEGRGMLGWRCCGSKCVEHAEMYDPFGMGWCSKHLDGVRKAIELPAKSTPSDELRLDL